MVYCICTFVHFFSFHFFSFWGFSVYKMQICFGFKNFFFFFLSTNFMLAKSWISTSIYWNVPKHPKWPEIFSKWKKNTLDKIPGVANVEVHSLKEWYADILLEHAWWGNQEPRKWVVPFSMENYPNSKTKTRGVGRENANKPIAIPRVSSPSNKPSDSQPNPSYNFHMLRAKEHEVVTKASTDASSRPLAKSRNSDVAREGETQELPLPHGTYTDCLQALYKPSCPLTSTVTPRLTSPSEIEMNKRCYVLPEQK